MSGADIVYGRRGGHRLPAGATPRAYLCIQCGRSLANGLALYCDEECSSASLADERAKRAK